MSRQSPARIRTTSEVNVKTNLKALVFGEDERIINPGDLLLVAEASEKGDRLGANVDRFEVSIAGRDIEGLLVQVERAAYLYRQNQDWLSQPATRMLTQEEIDARHELAKASQHTPKKRVVDPERLERHLLSLVGEPPKLVEKKINPAQPE